MVHAIDFQHALRIAAVVLAVSEASVLPALPSRVHNSSLPRPNCHHKMGPCISKTAHSASADTMSSNNHDDFTKANEAFAATFKDGHKPLPPARK